MKDLRQNKKKQFFCFLFFIISAFYVFSQESLKSIEEEYFDFLALQGISTRSYLSYRTLSDSIWEINTEAEHPWQNLQFSQSQILFQQEQFNNNWFSNGIYHGVKYRIYGPNWFNSYNSRVPLGQNDGALWQGKGYNTSFTAGFLFFGYGFSVNFNPLICWSQNLEFSINDDIYKNKYSYSWKKNVTQNIDYVQRYGDSAFFTFDFNQSEIRYSLYNFTIGFGTENPWLGPAYLNPMLGSNNSAGFPKLDFGIRKCRLLIPKIDFILGEIEARIWIGKLKQSDFFETDKNNTADRMINGISLSYAPVFIPNLTLGVNRIFLTRWQLDNTKYLFRLFTTSKENATSITGNDEDQKVAFYIDWLFPKSGFEFYGELGIDDFTSDWVTNPFHTAIYTIGAKQIIPLPKNLSSELILELNNFEMSQDFQLQWPYLGFYGHHFVTQGYTQNGQILGAGSGTFGNSQHLKYIVYFPKGSGAFVYLRNCPNTNSVYSQAVRRKSELNEKSPTNDSYLYENWYANFETYNSFGIEFTYFINNFCLNGSFIFTYINNRNYIFYNDDWNCKYIFNLKYNF